MAVGAVERGTLLGQTAMDNLGSALRMWTFLEPDIIQHLAHSLPLDFDDQFKFSLKSPLCQDRPDIFLELFFYGADIFCLIF